MFCSAVGFITEVGASLIRIQCFDATGILFRYFSIIGVRVGCLVYGLFIGVIGELFANGWNPVPEVLFLRSDKSASMRI